MWYRRVAPGNPGLIVWGRGQVEEEDEIPVGYFWVSADGTSWETHTADAGVFGHGVPISEFIWHEGVLIGVGGSNEDRGPAIYRWNP